MKPNLMRSNFRVLTTRMLTRGEKQNTHGLGSLLLPGMETPPFNFGAGVLGSVSSFSEFHLQNLFSKSDVYDSEKFKNNPSLPADVIAWAMWEGKFQLLESEISSNGKVLGALITSSDKINSEPFLSLRKELKKAFYLNEDYKLYEIKGKEELVPAKFESDVLSFDSNRASEELDQQNQALKGLFNEYVDNKARREIFTPEKSFSQIPIIRFVQNKIKLQALKTNPRYIEAHEEHEKRSENFKTLEKNATETPSTRVEKPESESVVRSNEEYYLGGPFGGHD